MTISVERLQSIAKLAYLETNQQDIETLAAEVNSIMNFVQQLSEMNTSGIAPLFHPMDLHQRLRSDEVTEGDCLEELAAIAPHFDEVYLVPKVIDAGN